MPEIVVDFIPADRGDVSAVASSPAERNLGSALRHLLLENYSELLASLARRIGSRDLAGEALAQCYLRLLSAPDVGPPRNPRAYLIRIALNIVADLRRTERRQPAAVGLDRLLEIPDDRPDAARIVENRADVALLREAMAELPERRRRVLILARLEDMPKREIAAALGVSVRTVELDLKHAVEHCAARMRLPSSKKNPSGRFAPAISQSSKCQASFDSFGSAGDHLEEVDRKTGRRREARSPRFRSTGCADP